MFSEQSSRVFRAAAFLRSCKIRLCVSILAAALRARARLTNFGRPGCLGYRRALCLLQIFKLHCPVQQRHVGGRGPRHLLRRVTGPCAKKSILRASSGTVSGSRSSGSKSPSCFICPCAGRRFSGFCHRIISWGDRYPPRRDRAMVRSKRRSR